MEITQHLIEDRLELRLQGRFDANWADHVGTAIEAAIRAGQHHIDLDLELVPYISSAGVRVLVRYFKQLNSVGGRVRIVRTTSAVLSTLQLSGIASMLVVEAHAPGHATIAGTPGRQNPSPAPAATQHWEQNGVTFETHEIPGSQDLDCQLH